MITDRSRSDGAILETVTVDKVLCDRCNRELKTSVEWMRTGNGVICENCYQSQLLPNMKISFDD